MGTSDRPPTTSSLLVLLLVLQSVTVVLSSSEPNATGQCPLKVYEPVIEPFRLENGSLWAGTPEQRYSPSQYRNNSNGTGYEVYVFKPCVFKCCPMDEMFIRSNNTCQSSNKTFDKELVRPMYYHYPAAFDPDLTSDISYFFLFISQS